MTQLQTQAIQCEVLQNFDFAWSYYTVHHADSTIYHDGRWGQLMQRAYGNRPFYLSARRGGQVVGTLQLVLQCSRLFGRHLSSLPYLDGAGILADDEEVFAALLDAAGRLMREHQAGHVELRQYRPLPGNLPTRRDKVSLRLELPSDENVLWKQVSCKRRNEIRKAKAGSLTTRRGREELLDDFYCIYGRTMRDLGSPPHNRLFFAMLLELFKEAAIVSVRDGARSLAASITLRSDRTVHLPWAGNDRRHRQSGANVLLYWDMLREASSSGARLFDFGRSTEGSGTHKFKSLWGAQPQMLYWHYILGDLAECPSPVADGHKFAQACWRRMPLWLSDRLGPKIIRKLA